MNVDDAEEQAAPPAPPAEQDAMLLSAVRTMLERVDPVPPGLVDRVRLAVELADLDLDLDFEMSWLVETAELAAVRADELARLVTFQSDSLSIMINIEQRPDGTTRIDGWLAPGACHRVELRCPTGPLCADTDDAGRFSLDAVPAGAARLIVHREGSSRIVTPAIEL